MWKFKKQHLDSEIHLPGSRRVITRYNIGQADTQKFIAKFIGAHPQVFAHLEEIEESSESVAAPADESEKPKQGSDQTPGGVPQSSVDDAREELEFNEPAAEEVAEGPAGVPAESVADAKEEVKEQPKKVQGKAGQKSNKGRNKRR